MLKSSAKSPLLSLSRIVALALPLSLSVMLTACGTSSEDEGSEAAAYRSDWSKSSQPSSSDLIEGRIVYCHDGDTCNAKIPGRYSYLKLRLAGIDAPEVSGGEDGRGQPMGYEARNFLNRQIKGKTVKIREIEKDPYGRTVAEIMLANGSLLNLTIVKEGYAEAYKWASWKINKTAYARAERDARAARKGIWSLRNYKSPGDFRREEKQSK